MQLNLVLVPGTVKDERMHFVLCMLHAWCMGVENLLRNLIAVYETVVDLELFLSFERAAGSSPARRTCEIARRKFSTSTLKYLKRDPAPSISGGGGSVGGQQRHQDINIAC